MVGSAAKLVLDIDEVCGDSLNQRDLTHRPAQATVGYGTVVRLLLESGNIESESQNPRC